MYIVTVALNRKNIKRNPQSNKFSITQQGQEEFLTN